MKLKSADSNKEINEVFNYIRGFNLNYPDYSAWVDKCRTELISGYKKAFYVKVSGNIVGSIIFQRHKKNKNILEIKNFRVSDYFRNKGIGTLLYSSVEKYALENKFSKIQVDANEDNTLIMKFLVNRGFKIIGKEPLYSQHQIEVIFQKDLR